MANAPDNVLKRIQTLLKVSISQAGKPGYEAESELARAKAQELLAQYNLDMEMVMDKDVQDEKREKIRLDRSAKFAWQKALWEALAEANFCWYWLQLVNVGQYTVKDRWGDDEVRYKQIKRHAILGRRSNVTAVQMMGEYLEDTMRRLCPYSATSKIEGGPKWAARGLVQRRSQVWYAGCAEVLVERIKEKAEEMKARMSASAPQDSTALVTLNDVYRQEYERNYDAVHGVGAYKRKQIADEKWQKEWEERQARAQQEREEAERKWLEYLQNETPEQKAEREQREARAQRAEERRWRRRSYSSSRWDRAREKEYERTHDEDYRAGRSAGHDIGLDPQVSAGSRAPKARQLT